MYRIQPTDCDNRNLMHNITRDYTVGDIVNKLRRGVKLSILAELCCMSSSELTKRLAKEGYTNKGMRIQPYEDKSKPQYSPITIEIKNAIKLALKKGTDTELLIDKYNLEKREAYACITVIKKQLTMESSKLYEISTIKGKRQKQGTMITVKRADLDE